MRKNVLHYWQLTLQKAGLLNDDRPYKRCLELWINGNFNEIRSIIQKALMHDPNSAIAHTFLGIALYHTGHTDESLSCLRKSLAIDAKIAVTHFYIGATISKSGAISDNALAKTHHRMVFEIIPDWIDNLVALGRLNYYTGSSQEAVQYLRRAIELDPENGDAHYLLICALAWLGEYENLEFHVREADRVIPVFRSELREIECENTQEKRSIRHARYPDQKNIEENFIETIKQTVLSDLGHVTPFITSATKFFTLGSCFARNLGAALSKAGYKTYNLNIGETINTTYAHRCIFRWVINDINPDLEKRMDELLVGVTREALINEIRNADVLIYTMGVAACFFDRQTGSFILPRASQLNLRTLATKYEYRTTSVAENVANMKAIIEEIRKINSDIKIFLAVSPVPMQATFERKASVVADCISKSVLRVVAEETLAAGYSDVDCWPSFEIVRWLGGHTGPAFGTDDGCSLHVSEKLVNYIVRLFIDTFRNEELSYEKRHA